VLQNTIFGKVRIESFRAKYAKASLQDTAYYANCYVLIQNRSSVDLYYRLDELYFSLGEKVSKNQTVESVTLLIPTGAQANINCASIFGLNADPINGHLKLKVSYGRQKVHLDHSMEVIAEPQIGFVKDAFDNIVAVIANLKYDEVTYI